MTRSASLTASAGVAAVAPVWFARVLEGLRPAGVGDAGMVAERGEAPGERAAHVSAPMMPIFRGGSLVRVAAN